MISLSKPCFARTHTCEDGRGMPWAQSWVPMPRRVAVMGRAVIPSHSTKPWLSAGRCPARVVWGTGPAHDQAGGPLHPKPVHSGKREIFPQNSTGESAGRFTGQTHAHTNKTLTEGFGLCGCMCCDTIRLSLSGLPAPKSSHLPKEQKDNTKTQWFLSPFQP